MKHGILFDSTPQCSVLETAVRNVCTTSTCLICTRWSVICAMQALDRRIVRNMWNPRGTSILFPAFTRDSRT